MIRTKPVMKRKIVMKRKAKHEIPFLKMKVSLSPEERPKQVTQPKPPKGTELKKGEYWCPYCAQVVKFTYNNYMGVNHCPRCGIIENDFYVKTANGLWKHPKNKKK